MEYTTPEQTPGSSALGNKKNLLIILILGIVLIGGGAVLFSQKLAFNEEPVEDTRTVVARDERSVHGRIVSFSPTGFTIEPINNFLGVDTVNIIMTPETVYERRGEKKPDDVYQREVAELEAQKAAALTGDAAAIEYIRTHDEPDAYHYTRIEDLRVDLRFALGDTVVVTSDAAIKTGTTDVVSVLIKRVTPVGDVEYSEERAQSF